MVHHYIYTLRKSVPCSGKRQKYIHPSKWKKLARKCTLQPKRTTLSVPVLPVFTVVPAARNVL